MIPYQYQCFKFLLLIRAIYCVILGYLQLPIVPTVISLLLGYLALVGKKAINYNVYVMFLIFEMFISFCIWGLTQTKLSIVMVVIIIFAGLEKFVSMAFAVFLMRCQDDYNFFDHELTWNAFIQMPLDSPPTLPTSSLAQPISSSAQPTSV